MLNRWKGASVCLFFFSSRRRHTRFDCDWSSDVCSSDLAANAARKIAGQTRRPLNRTAAKARPVGGQIGVALGWIEARVRPTFARTKYATPITRSSPAYFARPRAPGAARGSNLSFGNGAMTFPKQHSWRIMDSRSWAAIGSFGRHPDPEAVWPPVDYNSCT